MGFPRNKYWMLKSYWKILISPVCDSVLVTVFCYLCHTTKVYSYTKEYMSSYLSCLHTHFVIACVRSFCDRLCLDPHVRHSKTFYFENKNNQIPLYHAKTKIPLLSKHHSSRCFTFFPNVNYAYSMVCICVLPIWGPQMSRSTSNCLISRILGSVWSMQWESQFYHQVLV